MLIMFRIKDLRKMIFLKNSLRNPISFSTKNIWLRKSETEKLTVQLSSEF